MTRRAAMWPLLTLSMGCWIGGGFVPATDRWTVIGFGLAGAVLLGICWALVLVPAKQKTPVEDVSSINADRLAAGVDDLATLAGAGMAYRHRLEELGYSPTVAEQLAAHAVLHMQEQAFGGHR